MVSSVLIDVANILQSSVPLISLFAYIPQWRKLYKSKSSNDIAIEAWWLWTLSSSFALFYAIVHQLNTGAALALLFSCSVNLFFVVITLFMVFLYRKPK